MTDTASARADSAPLWDGFDEGELRLPFCGDCGLAHLPPGPVCPYCLSHSLTWRQASGGAVLSTWVVERNKWFEAFDPPYVVGEVQLTEGPRMPVCVSIEDLPSLRAGAAGVVDFALAPNGRRLPHFRFRDDA